MQQLDQGASSELRFRNRWWVSLLLALAWVLTACGLSTRSFLVLRYDAYILIPSVVEPFAANPANLLIFLCLSTAWLFAVCTYPKATTAPTLRSYSDRDILWSQIWVGASLLPLFVSLFRQTGGLTSTSFLDPIWFSACSGAAVYCASPAMYVPSGWLANRFGFRRAEWFLLACVSVAVTGWFWVQSHQSYADFMLGFNDFGHFTQRVANTANGHGLLLESPVLPAFWDHFNPAILLLVPIWRCCPSVEMIFILQALCLVSGGWLTAKIAKELGSSSRAATGWGMAWLFHPSVSQMNIAYTYGWHPISFAIPVLFLLLLRSIRRGKNDSNLRASRFEGIIDIVLLLAACLIEEGVIVILCLWCFFRSIRPRTGSWLDGGMSRVQWLGLAAIFGTLFFLVYRYSGLAKFQTGRFADLGSNPFAIMAYPVLRPVSFLSRVVEYRTLIFLACLVVPLYPWRLHRALWCWLPIVLPLGVLLVWNHGPAKSIAFQYATTLMPLLFVAAVVSSLGYRRMQEPGDVDGDGTPVTPLTTELGNRAATAAFATCFLMASFVGQLPWSCPTIEAVRYKTYDPNSKWQRRATDADGKWLHALTETTRIEARSVLATGRIAAHLVGCPDLETVGQFSERKEELQKIAEPGVHALQRYETIILDRIEGFQQSLEQTKQLEKEAMELGYQVESNKFDVVVLRRNSSQSK